MKQLAVVPIRLFWSVQLLLLVINLFCSLSAAVELDRAKLSLDFTKIINQIDSSKALRDQLVTSKAPSLMHVVQVSLNCISVNLTQFLKAMRDLSVMKPIDQLALFKDDLNKYKPNTPWITQSFMDMNLKQFSKAFGKTIKFLTVPQKRWFYFSNSPKNFDPEGYWPECLWQCIYLEKWMSGLSMDKDQLVMKDANYPKISFIKIITTIEQLGLSENLVNKYYQFYAFYTDCLSHFFCTAVYSCYGSLDDANLYKMFLATAKKSLSKMKQNLLILKKSKLFYSNYKLTLDSYKKILSLLEAEKIKTYAG